MNDKDAEDFFDGVETVIEHPVLFKRSLAIGDDAYNILRLKNKVVDAWDVIGVAQMAATVAKSSTVASTFFAPSSFLSVFGIGTAVTPVGWVITAGVIGGGAWWGITQFMKSPTICRVDKIPEFINTPLDVLALGLFDLLAPLSLKLAYFDGDFDKSEKSLITNYFVNEWGYDKTFIREGLVFMESRLSELTIEDLSITLSKFTADNPDCNYEPMSKNIMEYLNDIVDSDGKRTEAEILALEKIKATLDENNPSKIKNRVKRVRNSITNKVKQVKSFTQNKFKGSKQKV